MLVITYAIGGFSVPNLLKLGAIFPPYIIDNNEYFRILMAMFFTWEFNTLLNE